MIKIGGFHDLSHFFMIRAIKLLFYYNYCFIELRNYDDCTMLIVLIAYG